MKRLNLKFNVGDDYIIPVCQDEISNYPHGTDLTLWIYWEIKCYPRVNVNKYSQGKSTPQ